MDTFRLEPLQRPNAQHGTCPTWRSISSVSVSTLTFDKSTTGQPPMWTLTSGQCLYRSITPGEPTQNVCSAPLDEAEFVGRRSNPFHDVFEAISVDVGVGAEEVVLEVGEHAVGREATQERFVGVLARDDRQLVLR